MQFTGGPENKGVGLGNLICGPVEDKDCPWVLYVPKVNEEEESWLVKTYCSEHRCQKTRKVRSFNSKFLAKQEWLVQRMESDPKISTKSMQHEIQGKYELGVSKHQDFRAKARATKQLRGSYVDQYQRLRDYILELKTTNPGSTVKFVVEEADNADVPTRVFKRIYICLGALKEGFKACQREILGLDGAFMKGPFPSQLLTAVGLDPNNGIYPLAYAIVEAENMQSWTWFLQCVADDLDLPESAFFTFISDRQKGIIPAVAKVFPMAEHRFCLRHIHQNMKLKWRGKAFKDLLWGAATATTVQGFERKMEDLKKYNSAAHAWLSKIPPKHWARSHFSGRAHTDILLNNLCEVFNGKLVDGRDKPIITALDYVREYLMRRHVNVLKLISSCDGPLTPTAAKMFETVTTEANKYKVMWNGGSKYQVAGPWTNQFVVDVEERTCTCRRWEVTGMPCKHAVAANWELNAREKRVTDTPETWIHPAYWLDTWKKVYSYKIGPINGPKMWPKSTVPTVIRPPPYHTPVGRPKKQRRKDQVEIDDIAAKGFKLSRMGKSLKCSVCHKSGHNKRSCRAGGGGGQA